MPDLEIRSNFVLIDTLLMGRPDLFLDGLSHLILPAIALGSIPLAIITRITRASVLDVSNEDYVRTARAKGLDERRISSRHVMRNAWLPVVTVLGLQVGGLLAGAVITETVFAWGGVGRYVVDGIVNRDYFVIQSTILIFALVFLVVNLLVDILLRGPQPPDQVRLMAAPRPRRSGVVDRRALAGCGATRSAPAAQQAGNAGRCLHRAVRRRRDLRPVPRAFGPNEGGLAQRLNPPSRRAHHGHGLAGSRRVQPGAVRRPGQPPGRHRVGHDGRLHRRDIGAAAGGIGGKVDRS